MSQLLFDRIVNVKVFKTSITTNADGSRNLNNIDQVGTLFSSRQADGSPGFRIRARCNKIEGSTSAIPNRVVVTIWNLGPNSRALVSQTDYKLIIEAGYGNFPKQIFSGQIIWGRTYKSGSDYLTEIQVADGIFATQNSGIDVSFDKGAQVNQVINTLVGSLKAQGVGAGQITGVPNASYNQGIVITGNAVDELRKICDKNDLHFVIESGNIRIVPFGSDIGTPAQLISADTGMIGIPEIRANSGFSNENPLISFKHLLLPELTLFQKVLISSKFINGLYTTARVTHDIDSWEGPFFTEVECA